ncbi:MAG: hypothetical protein ACRC4K_02230 [Plesiomonas shigelloides]
MLKSMCKYIFVFIFCMSLIYACSSNEDKKTSPSDNNPHSQKVDEKPTPDKYEIPNGKSHDYQVIGESDLSFAGRKRMRYMIVSPTAATKEDRAQTAKTAAQNLQRTSRANLVDLWLVIGDFSNEQLAIATYIPDGCGNGGDTCDGKIWSIEASDIDLTEKQLIIWRAWMEYRDQFRVDGIVNESKLKKFLAKKLNVSESEIRSPWINRSTVL